MQGRAPQRPTQQFSHQHWLESVRHEESTHSTPVRVFFLGSGRLAVPVLETLLTDSRLMLAGIGTQPDRPAGRRQHLLATPVGQFAQARGLAVTKPDSVNTPAFLDPLRELTPDLIVVVSFGQILKHELLHLSDFGCLNVHASLLPRHRGASPVNAVILAGDTETGVSFMRMDAGLDTGPVYRVLQLPLTGAETAPELEERLARLAAEHIGACVWDVCRGGLQPVAQAPDGATCAKKLKKEDGVLDWCQPAHVLERRVRGLQPWPRAFIRVPTGNAVRRVQIVRAGVADVVGPVVVPGTVLEAGKTGWVVGCGSGALRLLRVVPEGRHEMDAAEFLRGCPVPAGTNLAMAHVNGDGATEIK